MSREILTSWGEFQAAIDRLLPLAQSKIEIYDRDLAKLNLGTGSRLEHISRLLQSVKPDCIRIALQETAVLAHHMPRLMRLLANHSQCISVQKTSDRIEHLRDTLILIDGRHGIVLFERSQPRFKLLIDDTEEIEPYRRRFDEIWREGGVTLGTTILGL